MLVAPDTAENDIVLLATLECVDGSNLNLLVEIFLEGPVVLHVIDDVRALALVGCDDTYLARHDTRFEKLGDNLLNI